MGKYQEIDLTKIKTISINARKSKVSLDRLAKPVENDLTFDSFLNSLPDYLAATDFKNLVTAIVQAIGKKKPVILMMGAHPIKVGLSPVIIDLMKTGIIHGLALNGAGVIHDVELSYFGCTSEEVADTLVDGSFGMSKETADLVNQPIAKGVDKELGFGEAVGYAIQQEQPEYVKYSLLGQAYALNIPVTVHVALGTDIVHQHPSAMGKAIGELSLRDFRIFAQSLIRLHDGGVVILLGSSVILPEVFLKALTVARNIAGPVESFTTANLDMIRHYRPFKNVLERPTLNSGQYMALAGHHEIMFPLLAAAIKQRMNSL